MDTPGAVGCPGRQLGHAGSPGCWSGVLENMELARAQPVVLALPFIIVGKLLSFPELQFLHL